MVCIEGGGWWSVLRDGWWSEPILSTSLFWGDFENLCNHPLETGTKEKLL